MQILDITGAALSLSATYCFTKAYRLAWILSLATIMVNFVLYAQKGIYGGTFLEIVYFFSILYGTYSWSKRDSNKQFRPITSLSSRHLYVLTALTAIGILIGSYILKTQFNSDIPLFDATITVLSLIAQWLICQKFIQCWHLWFIVDAMKVVLHYIKDNPFHSLSHLIYLGFAIYGYLYWKKLEKKQHKLALIQTI